MYVYIYIYIQDTTHIVVSVHACDLPQLEREREFFVDNLLVRIHLIIETVLVDRPCTMGVLIVRLLEVPCQATGGAGSLSSRC